MDELASYLNDYKTRLQYVEKDIFKNQYITTERTPW